MLGLSIDLDCLSDLVDDADTSLAIIAALIAACLIAAVVRIYRERSPVERIVFKRHFGV